MPALSALGLHVAGARTGDRHRSRRAVEVVDSGPDGRAEFQPVPSDRCTVAYLRSVACLRPVACLREVVDRLDAGLGHDARSKKQRRRAPVVCRDGPRRRSGACRCRDAAGRGDSGRGATHRHARRPMGRGSKIGTSAPCGDIVAAGLADATSRPTMEPNFGTSGAAALRPDAVKRDLSRTIDDSMSMNFVGRRDFAHGGSWGRAMLRSVSMRRTTGPAWVFVAPRDGARDDLSSVIAGAHDGLRGTAAALVCRVRACVSRGGELPGSAGRGLLDRWCHLPGAWRGGQPAP